MRASGFGFPVVCDFDAAAAGGAAVVWRVRPHTFCHNGWRWYYRAVRFSRTRSDVQLAVSPFCFGDRVYCRSCCPVRARVIGTPAKQEVETLHWTCRKRMRELLCLRGGREALRVVHQRGARRGRGVCRGYPCRCETCACSRCRVEGVTYEGAFFF